MIIYDIKPPKKIGTKQIFRPKISESSFVPIPKIYKSVFHKSFSFLLIFVLIFGNFLFKIKLAGAVGTTYYVDNCVVTGNDSNNGTDPTTPWLTINKVNTSSFVAGDTISFRKGCTWREQLTVPSSGSSGSPITFGAYGATGAQPIISGSSVFTSWTSEAITGGVVSADLFTETFNATGYDLGSWVEALGAGSTVDEDSTDVVDEAEGSSQILKIQKVSPNYNARSRWRTAGDNAITYSQFYVRIAAEGLSDTNSVELFHLQNTAFQDIVTIKLKKSGTDLLLFSSLFNNGTTEFANSSTVVKDTWYKVEFYYDTTNHLWSWKLNGVTVGSGSLTGTYYTGPRDWLLGDSATSKTLTAYFNNLRVSTTGFYDPGVSFTAYKKSTATQPHVIYQTNTRLTEVTSAKTALTAGTFYWDSGGSQVYVRTTGDDDPAGYTMEAGQQNSGVIRTNDKSYVTVDGLTIRDGNQQGVNVGSVSVTGIVFQNCTVERNAGSGFEVKGSSTANDVTINNCTIQNNGNWGISVDEDYTTGTISNNTLTGNGIDSVKNNQEYSQIDGQLGNFNIFGNTIYSGNPSGCKNGGLLGDYCHGIYYAAGFGGDQTIPVNIYQNKIYNNGYGVGIKAVGSANIYQNLVYGNDGSGISLGQNGAVNVVYKVYSNVVYGNNISNSAGGIVEQTKGAGTINLTLNNNTIYQNANTSGLELKITDAPEILTIKNNILFTTATRRTIEMATQTGTVNVDYNLHWRADGAPLMTYNSSGKTFSEWQALGFDTNGISVDPEFTTAGSNFTLQEISPAIDHGVSLGDTYKLGLNPNSVWPSAVNTLDQTLNGSGWDMGAYVYIQSTAPTVSLTAPSAGTVSGTQNVAATVSATSPAIISSVNFYLDNALLGAAVSTTSPAYSWDTTTASNASHTLLAVATDNYGNVATSSPVTVTVSNDATPPGVTLTVPSASATVHGSSVTLTATSTDNIAMAGVKFYYDSTHLIGSEITATSAPDTYTTSWNTTSGIADGVHTLIAVARDTSNNYATSSAVSITVDNTVPTVSLTAPSAGATVSSSTVAVTATTTDVTSGIGNVKFYLDSSILINTDNSSPYSYNWDSSSVVDGTHSFIAVATDNVGNVATSSAVSVTVDNTAPVRSSGSPSGSQGAGTTSVTLSLITGEVATCEYGTSASTAYASIANTFTSTASTTHSSTLSGLTNGQSYTYYVRCVDGQGNANSDDYTISFSVASPVSSGGGGGGGSVYPSIYSVAVSSTTPTSAVISWTTNYSTNSEVDYGMSTTYGLMQTNNTQTINHSLTLVGLTPATTYQFVVKSSLNGNIATSNNSTFATLTSSGQIITPTPPPNGGLPSSLTLPATNITRLINDHGTFYLIQNGVLQGITSPGILFSYGFEFKDAVMATADDLALSQGSLLLPASGALVKSLQDKTVYLIADGQRHAFISARIFLGLGFKFSNVLLVTNPELQALPKGANISDSNAAHMDGLNISYKGTVYWIGNGARHPYPSMAVYNSWNIDNDFSRVIPVNTADLKLPVGEIVTARVIQ